MRRGLSKIQKELRRFSNPKRAKLSQGYFKTGPGQYGEGDIFIGPSVPQVRQVAKLHAQAPLQELEVLIHSPVHEDRLLAVIILGLQYRKGSDTEKKRIHKFYLRNIERVNNWDLVDTSAPLIVGEHLVAQKRDLLYKFARSKNIWRRRIAVLSTFAFIRENDFKDLLALSEILLHDKEDLMHKAVGWLLREAGKKDPRVLNQFLDKHSHEMPRTMLRYALEKLSPQERAHYLAQKTQKTKKV